MKVYTFEYAKAYFGITKYRINLIKIDVFHKFHTPVFSLVDIIWDNLKFGDLL